MLQNYLEKKNENPEISNPGLAYLNTNRERKNAEKVETNLAKWRPQKQTKN